MTSNVSPQPMGPRSNFGGQRGLPSWSVALPLWAAARWLWIAPAATGEIRYHCGGSGEPRQRSHALAAEELPLSTSYPLIIFDRRRTALEATWWPLLAQALEPGGVLFVCGPRAEGLPTAIHEAAPQLRPSEWHVIEGCQDSGWRLRPATNAALKLFDMALQPPLSLGALLEQLQCRWMPTKPLACLPIWRENETR